MSEAPKVYAAIAAVTRALGRKGVAKARSNIEAGYSFRGIDDVTAALSPLLARHRLCMLPRMLERGCTPYRGERGEMLFATWVRAAFDLVSTVDGSRHSVESFGEATDAGDKGTAKAMSAAFKYAVLQSFCVPVTGQHDADAQTPATLSYDEQVPSEGWGAWSAEVIAIVGSCMTHEAIERVQARHRQRLRLLSRTDPALFSTVGEAFRKQRESLPVPPTRAAA